MAVFVRCAAAGFLSTLSLRRATSGSERILWPVMNFYPRSPCGERRGLYFFLPRLLIDFYPRSPCGERRFLQRRPTGCAEFLSTLSLRRATFYNLQKFTHPVFLSTLSLRRATDAAARTFAKCAISIHALLAESDPCVKHGIICQVGFLSTLSLRRATFRATSFAVSVAISIHALLAESD